MARGSALEVQTQIEAARMLEFGNCGDLSRADDTAMEVLRILSASIATNQAKIASRSKKSGSPLYSLLLTLYTLGL
jgi:hypothetical protein